MTRAKEGLYLKNKKATITDDPTLNLMADSDLAVNIQNCRPDNGSSLK